MRRIPLRWRLSAITAAIALLALLLSSAAVITLVRNSLLTQVDDQLHTALEQLRGPKDPHASQGPSDYHVRYLTLDGQHIDEDVATTFSDSSPDLPDLTRDEIAALEGQTFRVPSTAGSVQWQVLAITDATIRFTDGTTVDGSVMVAVPLVSVDRTTTSMVRIMALVGISVVTLAALLGYVAVQRSLRPLRGIETAARAVAAGDLTRRVELEPPSTEVGRLGLSFNTMVAELEEAFAQREASEQRMRRFVSDASHELRTPLASIRGYGELYRMGGVPEGEIPATMARIESEATRMGRLVTDLLALARLDEGRGLRLGDVDLAAIAADGIADLGALDPSRPAELLASGPVVVRGDADRLRQVLTNLIGNAVQHTPRGTPVEVATGADDDGWAWLSVRDHGPGIDDADAAKVFERFYRPDTSRTRASGGSGLGLAIVATIVAAHGGTVRTETTPGGGATFIIRLPRDGLGSDSPSSERD